MSDDSTDIDVERLTELVSNIDDHILEFKEVIVGGDSESDIVELAEDLWEVLDEVEDVLETIDFEEVPEAIDIEELPEAIDVEDVPEGLFDEDESAIELTSVKEAINLRKLWDAVDLTDLYEEKQELESEVEEATDTMGDEDDDGGLLGTDMMDDDEDDGLLENVVGIGDGAHMQFNAEARQAVIEEMILDAVVKFRKVLLTTHDKLEKLYRMNQEKLGQPGRQPNSLNPTAASTMPPGPVPETASLRTSTVPSQVRYSRIENPRRIYAHRFHEATEDEEDDEEDVEEETQEDTDAETGTAEDEQEEPAGEESPETGDETEEEDESESSDEHTKLESVEEAQAESREAEGEDDEEIIIEVHNE